MTKDAASTEGRSGPERATMGRRSLLTASMGLAAAAMAAPGTALAKPAVKGAARAAPGEVVATTTYGKVRGARSADGVITFRGIPYGGSTAGKNRFMPPTRPAAWTGVRDALEFGQISPQLPSSSRPEYQTMLGGPTDGLQGEDCLVLNVWTKGVRDGAKRPVYVRIHGGGFTTGSGARPMYQGHNTARRGDVMYVSMNHRLDCFGLLDLSSYDPRFAKSGNASMLDLVAMLEWVRDNAENFGGDPNRVMIAGESGGGFKVSTLLGMPSAKGLFHRAVIESGPGLNGRTPAEAAETTDRLLSRLGLGKGKLDELQHVPLHRMLYASAMTFTPRYYPDQKPPRGWNPVVDGDIIPRPMFEPVATPISADIPLIVGSNRDEGTMMRQQDNELYELTDAMLQDRVRQMVGDKAGQVISVYRQAYPSATPSALMIQIATDSTMGVNSNKLAERKAALGKAPVYMYRFDWKSPVLNGKFGATHGLEIPFTAYNVSEMAVMTDDRPDAHALAAQMNDAWIAFARTGDPNTGKIPHWPAYTAADRSTMLFNTTSTVERDPIKASVRQVWTDVLPPRLL